MNGTQDLAKLASDPQAFDTRLAGLHKQRDDLAARIARIVQRARYEAGAVRRGKAWSMTPEEALAKVPAAREQHDALAAELAAVSEAIRAMGEVYSRAPWSRFFPSVTKSQPHIHASLGCRTLHIDTVMSWAPELSGKTEPEAVAELDEALCSVCFPSAPVALHNYTSRRSQEERAARAAEKTGRDAARAVKTLADDEQFRTAGHYGERVSTVAKCKELLRAPIETAAELAWYRAGKATGWAAESLARLTGNLAEKLAHETADAGRAERVLLAREARQPGTGADAAGVAKIRAAAGRRAGRDWAL